MPMLQANARVIASALNRGRGVWQIKGAPGLHLAVLGEGRGSWRLRYRPRPGAQQRWFTIGDAENIDLKKAIGKARAVMSGIQLEGRDPQEEKQITLKSSPFRVVYEEWLDHPGRKQTLRERTREGYERIFKLHVEPHIGSTAISALTDNAIRNAVEKVRKKTTNAKKGQRGLQATHALKLIHAVCEYATDKNYIGRNPARGVGRPVPMQNPEGRQHRPPTDEELRMIWNETPEHMNAQNVRILRLALLLGKRVSEIVEAKKSEVHLEGEAYWFIPGTRTGNKAREDEIVPLPKLAVDLLRDGCAANGASQYVFPARSREDKPTTRHAPSQAFTDLRRAVGIGEEVRFHDTRGLIVDQMSKLKVPREYRSHVLHHTGDMRATLADAAYSTYDFAAEKRRALRLWSLRLQEIVRGRRPRGLHW